MPRDNVVEMCRDREVRTCGIIGNIKRKMWIRYNNLVLVVSWDFQSDRADMVWQYIAANADKLELDGYPDDRLRQMNNKVIGS